MYSQAMLKELKSKRDTFVHELEEQVMPFENKASKLHREIMFGELVLVFFYKEKAIFSIREHENDLISKWHVDITELHLNLPEFSKEIEIENNNVLQL